MSLAAKLRAAAEREIDRLGGDEEDALIVKWARSHAYDDFRQWAFERALADVNAERTDYQMSVAEDRAHEH